MTKKTLLLTLALLLISFSPAQSASTHIAAVVNDSIISDSDVAARLRLILLSAGLEDRAEMRAHFLPQALRTLIEEQLQLQEGKKLNIAVTEEEINDAMTRLAQENRIPGGDMRAFLRAHNIKPSTLLDQIRATLTWNKVVMQQIRPRIDVGEDEINAVIERIRASAGKQEYLLSEIFIPAESDADEARAAALAENIARQLRQGAVFGAMARQFSQGLGASNGGDLGWIQRGQLDPALDQILPTMGADSIAGPIRTAKGFHILGLRDKRTIAVGGGQALTARLQQLFRPFSKSISKQDLLKEAESIRAAANGCQALDALAKRFSHWELQDLGEVGLQGAPSWLVQLVAETPDDAASSVMATEKGALIVFVCSRTAGQGEINRDAVLNALGTEKLELMAQRLLRDLRKDAYIEIRLEDRP
ncbi:MAG: peptidylprolyl isomerase [Alphaproteobacteria bacterium]|nr:peptidylprolyl isomerase [Alphaproteobacteria bacterium]